MRLTSDDGSDDDTKREHKREEPLDGLVEDLLVQTLPGDEPVELIDPQKQDGRSLAEVTPQEGSPAKERIASLGASADDVVDEVPLQPDLGLEADPVLSHPQGGDRGRMLQRQGLHGREVRGITQGTHVAQSLVTGHDGESEHGGQPGFLHAEELVPPGRAGEVLAHLRPAQLRLEVGARKRKTLRRGQHLQRDIENDHRILQKVSGLVGQLLPAPAADHYAEQGAVYRLRLLELGGLAVDDDLGRVLHESRPAQALGNLDDGELALLGERDDIRRNVLDETGGLDEKGGRAGHHHPPAELALPLQVAPHRVHGGEHHLSSGEPVGDVGDLSHRHRGHPPVEPGLRPRARAPLSAPRARVSGRP